VDVTNNKLEADEGFLDVIRAIPGLRALSVNGNEVARLPHFRKRLLTLCPMLGYLDRPVDERERYVAAAFVAGGAEAEKAAIEGWREEQVRGGAPLIAVFVSVACCRLRSLHRVCRVHIRRAKNGRKWRRRGGTARSSGRSARR
jgi:hypothetical protein